MFKRIISVLGVLFICAAIIFVGTAAFQIAAAGMQLSEDQLYSYSGSFGIALAAVFMGVFTHVRKIGKDMSDRKDKSIPRMIAVSLLAVCILPILADSLTGLVLSRFITITENATYSHTLLNYIISIIIAPVVEEVLFRKGIYGYTKQKLGAAVALILSSLIFAAVHGYNLQGFLSTLYAGIVLALIYEKSGNIMYSVSAHMMLNLFVNVANALQRSGLKLYYEVNGYCIYVWPVLLAAALFAVPVMVQHSKNNLELMEDVQQ